MNLLLIFIHFIINSLYFIYSFDQYVETITPFSKKPRKVERGARTDGLKNRNKRSCY